MGDVHMTFPSAQTFGPMLSLHESRAPTTITLA